MTAGGEQAELRLGNVEARHLVVRRPQGFVEALAIHVARLDVAEVRLPEERSRVADFGEHLCQGYLLARQPAVLVGEADVIHAVADRVAPGDHRRARWSTRRLRVHSHEVDALGSQSVHVGRLPAPNLLDLGDADLTQRSVVPHDMDEVRRCAVLGTQGFETRVELRVLGSPGRLLVLRLEDVVLGVVDDLRRS